MSEGKWTRGPWTDQPQWGNRGNRSEAIIYGPEHGGRIIARCPIGMSGSDVRREVDANAALIAEAPALADALADVVRILEAVRYTAGLGNKQMERLKSARAILARARGETP